VSVTGNGKPLNANTHLPTAKTRTIKRHSAFCAENMAAY
jgi:hypothetical protein